MTEERNRDQAQRRNRRRRRRRARELEFRIRTVLILILVVIVGGILFRGCSRKAQKEAADTAGTIKKEATAEKKAVEDGKTADENTLRILAVGDNVIHEGIYESADTSSGTWNFDKLYEHVAPDIQSADIASVNEECIFVKDHNDLSGYPKFGAPTEIGDALVNAGFDVVTMANNHVYDKGTDGILQTLDYWSTSHPDTTVLGIHENNDASKTIRTLEIKNIKIAMLDYTCLVNGDAQSDIPTGMVDFGNESKMQADVQQARNIADVVMVYLHAGTEYATEPDTEQKTLLKMLLSEGVDIVICSHPHVLQGYETLSDANGHQMLVYYSLGNFLSAQKEPRCLLGGMADITLSKDASSGKVSISSANMIPLVTHYNYEQSLYTVYKLSDYTDELAAVHSVHQESDEEFTLQSLQNMYNEAINSTYHVLDE